MRHQTVKRFVHLSVLSPKMQKQRNILLFPSLQVFSNSSYISPLILFLRECSIKMFLHRGSLQEMRNWYKASIRSKSVRNTELIESIECFLFVLFLDIPDSYNKTTNIGLLFQSRKKKGKRTDQLRKRRKAVLGLTPNNQLRYNRIPLL